MGDERLMIEQIRMDGGTQARVKINGETINQYADLLTEGTMLPPVVVFYDGTEYWLADGFHRVNAALKIGLLEIDCAIVPGTRVDAIDFASSSEPNGKHGLQEKKADRENRVLMCINNHSDWSLRKVADHTGVSYDTVARYRSSICQNMTDRTDRTVTRGDSTYTMNTGKIGKAEKKESAKTPRYVEVERESVHVPERMPEDGPDCILFNAFVNRIIGRAAEIRAAGINTEESFLLALTESYQAGLFILP